nr:MAG TPA: Tail fiber protein [Caudoviricetes sp.]DAH86457.1 MAG TPA: Tail fiber protein [Caudoviricetes sp.]
MLPDGELSTSSVYAAFLVPNRIDELIDYEWGGIDLYDASQGLQAKLWTCFYESGVIKAKADQVVYDLITVADVTALSFAFDLNMRPVVTYVVNNEVFLWWYDTAAADHVTTSFGSLIITPQLSLDDHRTIYSANADVIFAYIKAEQLCIRLQRDRYQIEYELGAGQVLIQIGMMTNNRFGFATKIMNGFDLFLDQMYVDARNKALRFDYLDLCPLQASYSVQFGNNVIKAEGLNEDALRTQFENIENVVSVAFNLKEKDFDYFMSFFRIWQHKRKPFYIDLVLDQRPLTQYLAHFVHDSVSMTKSGAVFKVSAQLLILNNDLDKSAIKTIAESRNVRA